MKCVGLRQESKKCSKKAEKSEKNLANTGNWCYNTFCNMLIVKSGLREVHSFILSSEQKKYRSAIRNNGKEVMRLTKREEYESRAEKMLEPMMEEHQFELVDVEWVKEAGNWYLRAYIDKEGGITLDDCELINRAWSDMLDQEDFIEEVYILEVSSPGLGRQLKKEKDFRRSIGEDVDVKFYSARKIPGGKNGKEVSVKEITGVLTAYDTDTITLETDFDPAYVIPRGEIASVKLTIDF